MDTNNSTEGRRFAKGRENEYPTLAVKNLFCDSRSIGDPSSIESKLGRIGPRFALVRCWNTAEALPRDLELHVE